LWLRSRSPEATGTAGRLLGEVIGAEGAVLALCGPLGAGKTVFAKGLAAGLGIDPARVASPTFVIACEYPAPDGRRLAHVDCYRLTSPAELEAAGFLDLLEPGTVVVVEWADRFPDALPPDHLAVRFAREPGEGSRRWLSAVASGPAAESLLARWREAIRSRGRDSDLEPSERGPGG
jgi:tRNA threonylcarbamoyladenosine biosynthesis protein TsaE